MPNYDLSRLGSTEFEHLVQAVIKKVIGAGTITFGAGRDGAREATYEGSAPYPSQRHQFSGKWIFQAKYHDLELLGVGKARKQVLSELEDELDKITNKYKHPCNNYILATNVPLTGVAGTGNLDTIANSIAPKYSDKIENIHVWGADDINRFLENYVDIRTSYLHFIVAGDVLHQLIKRNDQEIDDLAITVKEYVKVLYTREQNAQLDQAGDMSEEPVRIQHVFFDLLATYDQEISSIGGRQLAEFNRRYGSSQSQSRENSWSPLLLLTTDSVGSLVIVGGPGEGKSTIGQFLAQIHRARLIGKSDEITIDEPYAPVVLRIPLRIVLRDFAQWLARPNVEGINTGRTLDEYLTGHIEQATARPITTKELHRVIQENPTLLIFDGLDEVTGEDIRRSLLDRLAEFTDRCRTTFNADMQILAATRPTGYSNQFSPKTYLHLRLIKLVPNQVRDYVVKWIGARPIEPSKAEHLKENIEECLIDPQIKLLTNTPLQVTILVLIISSGGAPPRQREALFDEYLNVIYKRETGKGKNVVSSEREKLVGLHEYIGYILHEKATSATSASAVLDRPDYEAEVMNYLKYCDPFSAPQKIKAVQRAITTDAGERLVLLVEPRSDQFGFELRSIQEFFAACHMTDTSTGTDMRYRRFDAIARLDHWRNVALYFAGRVGRNYSGETGNIIEVCHDLNRETHSSIVHRGSILALELAADRAFGHNRRGQRRLLEIALESLERSNSYGRLLQIKELLQKLPVEDVRDHVSVLLRQKLELLDSRHIVHFPEVVYACKADPELQRVAVLKLAENADTRSACLENIYRLRLSQAQIGESTVSNIVKLLSSEQLVRVFASLSGGELVYAVERSLADGVSDTVIWSCLSDLFAFGQPQSTRTLHGYRVSLDRLEKEMRPRSMPGVLVTCLLSLGLAVQFERETTDGRVFRPSDETIVQFDLDRHAPNYVIQGQLDPNENQHLAAIPDCLLIIPWMLHALIGDVTPASARAFVEILIRHRSHSCIYNLVSDLGLLWRPVILVVVDSVRRGDKIEIGDAVELLCRFGGKRGFEEGQALEYRVSQWSSVRLRNKSELHRFMLTENDAQQLGISWPFSALESSLVLDLVFRASRVTGALTTILTFSDIREVAVNIERDGFISERNWHSLASFDIEVDVKEVDRPQADIAYVVSAMAKGATIAAREADVRLCLEYAHFMYRKKDLDSESTNIVHSSLARFSNDPAPSMYSWNRKPVIARMIHGALKCLISRQSVELTRGARFMIDVITTSARFWADSNGVQTAKFSFRGFNASHRAFAESAATEDDIHAALNLFTLRKISSSVDMACLKELLSRASARNIAYFFGILPGDALRNADQRDFWVELVSSLIPDSRLGADHAALVDAMAVLLAEADQSLAMHERELGLPLVVEAE
ncbi:hypothetical protein OG738_06280 [Amycolatopsis sp. NBC_01488]|uniref:NACHT domain-containing protein n=1 Tax=Amycolatopsis sp. NBC_01488 TaxID=2903563 RepID=UPI002E2D9CAD|nr:hypothetical protein [Amycolatopsis sp. NBC_01488]